MDEPGSGAPKVPRQWVPAIVLDAALGVAIVAVTLVVAATGGPEADGRALTWADGAAGVAVAGLVLVRRRWPNSWESWAGGRGSDGRQALQPSLPDQQP